MRELARLRTRCRELVRDVLRGCGEPRLEDLVLPASLPRGLGLGLGPGTDPSLGLGVSRSVASSSTTSARSCVKRLVMATRRRASSPRVVQYEYIPRRRRRVGGVQRAIKLCVCFFE